MKRIGFFQVIGGDVNLAPLRGEMDWVCRKGTNSFTLNDLAKSLSKEEKPIYIVE